MSKPRFILIFGYMAFALGWIASVRLVHAWLGCVVHRYVRTGGILLSAIVFGSLFSLVWNLDRPLFTHLVPVLNVVFWVGFVFLIVGLRNKRVVGLEPGIALTVVSFIAFLSPSCLASSAHFLSRLAVHSVHVERLFSDDNPRGVQPTTIQFIRSQIPPRSRILVDPLNPTMVGLFAPVYVVPLRAVTFDYYAFLEPAQQGRDPLFNAALKKGRVDIPRLIAHLRKWNIDYILGESEYGPPLAQLAAVAKDDLELVYRSEKNDVVLRVRKGAQSP